MTETIIHSNGSKWAGEKPDTIDMLIERLNKYTIEERFFHSFWAGQGKDRKQYQHCPISESNGKTWFFGNFEEISGVFRIETDDKEFVSMLTPHIKNNKGWVKYYEKNLVK